MPCACQNRRQTFEVVPNAGAATRAAFTSSSAGTAEAVADRYPMSVVRDKKTGEAVYFSWPKGSYEVVLQGGEGEVIRASTMVRTAADRGPLKATADSHAEEGAVIRVAGGGAVVYPLPAALTASGSTLKAAATPAPAAR
ncbi:hypothetical protein QEH48_gp016 [Streptomyces phage TurkishDelight]|uniref:Uncharacterized protein n=1 Tax=Streptomyces phage TurkishDelight TaxID=2793708 RepID=A0A7T0Q3C5_9CAUD|nr:hypothetical protein QEH48_gp016 [Streptomyces phage TurkishDelight]QPL14045.1 hypothetical protein SEA_TURKISHDELIGHT_16 [Streptomyces phage TurkishDelight]